MADSINSKAKEYYDNDDSGGSLNNNLKDFLKQQGATGNSINTLWRSYAYGEGGNSLNTRLGKLWGTSGSLMKRWQDVLGLTWDEIKAFFNFRDTDPDFLLDGSTSFDGSNDYIDCGTGLGNALGDNYAGSFTVSMWLKINDTSGDVGAFEVGSFDPASWVGIFAFRIKYNTLSFITVWSRRIEVAFSDTSSWHHIVGVYDSRGADFTKLYVDGVSVGSATGSFPSTSDLDLSGKKTIIGAYYSASNSMGGEIANVGIWNRSLSSSEIESIRWRGSHSELKDTELTNLVSWYDLQGDVLDKQGSNDGTNNGATLNTDSYSGKSPFKPRIQDKANPKMAVQLADGSTSFDGSNDYIDCGTGLGTTLGDNYSGNLTVSMWFKADAYDDDGMFSISSFSSSVGNFAISTHSSHGLIFGLNGYNWYRKYNFSDTSSWHHLACVYNTSGESSSLIYLDGSSVSTGTSGSFPADADMDFSGLKTIIGAYVSTSFAFDGSLANVAIHSSALTQTQIQELMFTEKYSGLSSDLKTNLVSWYDLGSSSNPHNDLHGSNNGTNNGATVNTGYTSSPHGVVDPLNYGEVYSGRVLDFDGSNDAVDIPNSSEWNMPKTVSMWFKCDAIATNGAQVYQRDTLMGYDTVYWGIQLDSTNNKIQYYFHDGSAQTWLSDTAITIGKWHHLVVVSTSSNSTIYLDGLSVGTNSLTWLDNTVPSLQQLKIGSYGSSSSVVRPFNGKISNVKIFNSELTQAQVQELFTAPETVLPTGVSASNLKLDLPMQEGAGSYVYDGSIRVGSELVVNGDMELDSNWGDVVSPAINERSTEIVRTGTYSRKIVGDSSYDGMAQSVTVVAGESYLVSGWVYGDGTNKLYARAYDGGGSGYDNFWIGSSNDGIVVPAEWTYYQKIFKAVGTSFNIQILQGDQSAGGVTFYADDISLKNVTDGQNHGTISGATWATGEKDGYQSSLVRSNTPMIFDGSDDNVTVSDILSSQYTISGWVKYDAIDDSSWQHLFGQSLSGLETKASSFEFYYKDSSPYKLTGSWTINSNEWVHIAVTNSSTTKSVYLNGVQKATVSDSSSYNPTGTFYIGNLNTGEYVGGIINEVAVWDVGLDADAVTALYNSGTPLLPTSDSGNYDNSGNLVGYWRNDGITTWTDRSTNSNNGTASGSPVSIVIPEGSTSGRDSQGFLLSDTTSISNGMRVFGSEYINIQDSEVLSFGDGVDDKPFSLEAWIKMDDATKFKIFAKGIYNTNAEYVMEVNSDDKLRLILYDEDVADTVEIAMYNTAITSYEGQWIHVCATYNGVGGTSANAGIKLYINGSNVATTLSDAGTYVSMVNGSADVHIGRDDSDYAKGLIDEPRIYSKELSASEITKNYNNGKSAHQ
tara:strand:- start:11557 stop:15672 length:4116 start_codon:yes stop_codon:yes gene_type:complete